MAKQSTAILPRVSITVPKDMHKRLLEEKKKNRSSIATIVRQALDRYFGSQ